MNYQHTYKHVVVIGRVLFDDEDAALEFESVTPARACELFEGYMLEDNDDPDAAVIVNHVIASDGDLHLDSSI